MKFEIPASSKNTLKNELNNLGYTAGNLFPDLEHLAQELRDSVSPAPVVAADEKEQPVPRSSE